MTSKVDHYLAQKEIWFQQIRELKWLTLVNIDVIHKEIWIQNSLLYKFPFFIHVYYCGGSITGRYICKYLCSDVQTKPLFIQMFPM